MADSVTSQFTPLACELTEVLIKDIQVGLTSGRHLTELKRVLGEYPSSARSADKLRAAVASLLVDQALLAGRFVSSCEAPQGRLGPGVKVGARAGTKPGNGR